MPSRRMPRLGRGHVYRARLTERIEAGDAVTVLRAPAGYGKTALLAEWAQSRALTFWVDASGESGTQTAIWRDALTAISEGLGLEPSHAASVLSETFLPEGAYLDHLVSALRSVGEPVCLVVDSAEELHDELVLADLLAISERYRFVRFVLATRTVSVLESADARVRVDVTVVEAHELLFTAEEGAEALRSAYGAATADAWKEVETASARVPILVRLAGSDVAEQRDISSPRVWLQKRLQVLADSDLRTRGLLDALTTFSATEFITRPLAAALDVPVEAIDWAETMGLGSSALGRAGLEFRLTRLALDALRERAQAQDRDLYIRTRRSFADWAWKHEYPVEALIAAADIEDHALSSAVITDYWFELFVVHQGLVPKLFGTAHRSTLLRWPILAAALALQYFGQKDHQWKAREMFGIAMLGISIRRRSATPDQKIVFSLLEMVAARITHGRSDRASRVAQRLATQLEELPTESRAEIANLIPYVVTQVSATLLFGGETTGALNVLMSGSSTARLNQPHRHSRYFALSLRAGAHALAGEMSEAEHALAELALIPGQEARHNNYSGSPARLAEAYLHLEAGRPVDARARLAPLREHYETIENVHLLLRAEAWSYIGAGQAHAGLEFVRTMRVQIGRQRTVNQFVAAHLAQTLVMLTAASGDVRSAETHLDQIPRHAMSFTTQALHAHLALLRGDPHRALAALGTDLAEARTPRERAARSLLQAVAHDALDEGPSAARAFTSGVTSMTRDGLTLPLRALMPHAGSRLLRLATAHGDERTRLFVASLAEPGETGEVQRADPRAPRLTRREHDVLLELARTPRYASIATALFVTLATVRTHVRSIYRKLGVTNREDALAAARKANLLD